MKKIAAALILVLALSGCESDPNTQTFVINKGGMASGTVTVSCV